MSIENYIISTNTPDVSYINYSQTQNAESVIEEIKTQSKTDSAVEVNLSQKVLSEINNIISKEDSINIKLNKAQTIYESLADIRLKISELLETLNNDEIEHNIETLEELDEKSNSLINEAINVVKINDTMNIADINYLDIFYNGLNSLKELKITNENYLYKIGDLMKSVFEEENTYLDLRDKLYSNLTETNNSYSELVSGTKSESALNSKTLQKDIITNYAEVLKDSASKLTPEIVLSLL